MFVAKSHGFFRRFSAGDLRVVEILADRGVWRDPAEKNSIGALGRALRAGYGIETDLRDLAGELVVSHDPPLPGALPFSAVLDLHARLGSPARLALNIKADGLAFMLRRALAARGIGRYFVFDMAVPDAQDYLALGMPVFTRSSEYEEPPAFLDRAAGLWMDGFGIPWVPAAAVAARLAAGTSIALVSPKLHRRPHREAWAAWRPVFAAHRGPARIMLCTDFPADAAAFFGSATGA